MSVLLDASAMELGRRIWGCEVSPVEVVREAPTESAARLPGWIVLDVSKARAELGWEPAITLEQGLERLYAESLARV